MNDQFDVSKYNLLPYDDRRLIDEYSNRLSVLELNSFVNRLLNYYRQQEEIEVQENDGIVLAFESPIPLTKNEIRREYKLPYELLWKQFSDIKTFDYRAKFYLVFAIKKYIENDYLRNVKRKVIEQVNFAEFLKHKDIQSDLFSNGIGWVPDSSAIDKIYRLYVEFADDTFVNKIDSTKVKFGLYTIQQKHNKVKKNLGIVLDKKVLNNTCGYSKNYRIDPSFLRIKFDENNLAVYIKSVGYWSPKNARLDGYDNNVGIIWMRGKASEDKWVLSPKLKITYDTSVELDFIYTTDAYSKMLNRIKFQDKVRQAMSEFENKGQANGKYRAA